jgi:hypothetical protein
MALIHFSELSVESQSLMVVAKSDLLRRQRVAASFHDRAAFFLGSTLGNGNLTLKASDGCVKAGKRQSSIRAQCFTQLCLAFKVGAKIFGDNQAREIAAVSIQ